ncbi:hypothetical protein ACOMHN_064231 [Nucella lapillus]
MLTRGGTETHVLSKWLQRNTNVNLRCPLARAQGCTQLQQEYRPQMNLRCPLARAQGCTQLQQEYRPQMNLRCPLARA